MKLRTTMLTLAAGASLSLAALAPVNAQGIGDIVAPRPCPTHGDCGPDGGGIEGPGDLTSPRPCPTHGSCDPDGGFDGPGDLTDRPDDPDRPDDVTDRPDDPDVEICIPCLFPDDPDRPGDETPGDEPGDGSGTGTENPDLPSTQPGDPLTGNPSFTG